MAKEVKEQSLREWIEQKRSELIHRFLEWQKGEITNIDYNKYAAEFATTIIAEYKRRLEKSALTPEQILMKTKYIATVESSEFIDAELAAVAQLKASLEAVK